jgi:cell division protein FtsB
MSQTDLPLEPPSPARSRRKLGNAHEARERRRRLVTWGLVLGSFILMVNALFGEYGYLAGVRARQEYLTLLDSLTKVQDENRRILDQIRALDTDPAALEDVARRKLGLVRPGETLVIIHDTPRPATPSSVPQ